MKKTKIISFVIALFFFFCPFAGALAAEIYLDPASATVAPGSVLSVKVKIDPEIKECINAAQVIITFSEALSFQDFSVGESIFSLWIEKPGNAGASLINKSRRLTFAGGIPGGYCGQISGDSGDSNILGELHFQTGEILEKDYETAYIKIIDDSKAFLNDGAGTEVSIPGAEANIRIDRRAATTTSQWADDLAADKILPEPFVISIDEYRGHKFAAFSTTDKQTGIDHYEVMEVEPADLRAAQAGFFARLFRKEKETLSWQIIESPYYLKDQTLQSVIKIKAVDKAGNERIIEYQNVDLKIASSGSRGFLNLSPYLLPGLLAALIIILVLLIIRMKKR